MGSRAAVLEELVHAVCGAGAVVAVDGPDAAGKTTLADELADRLGHRGAPTVRVTLDGFHRPAAARRARGSLSPIGYVEDSFDLAAFADDVLEPLGAGGDRMIVTARHDWRTDAAVAPDPVHVPEEACVLVDGVFLHSPELADRWDASVFVYADPEVVLARARARDADAFGGPAEVERRYAARYLPGQALYFARDRPDRRATVCVENSDPAQPQLSRAAVAAGIARWIEEHGGG